MANKKVRAHCNRCLGPRQHDVLHEEVRRDKELTDSAIDIVGAETFRMLKCCGCRNISLQETSWSVEDCDANGKPHQYVTSYPPEISRAEPSWTIDLAWFGSNSDEYIAKLLREIYSAMHNDSRRLVVMGIRALLEHIMVSAVGDKESFKNNLDAYQHAGFLSPKQREIIEPILEAGHATIHRGYDPSADDVRTVMDIAEGLIETTVVHPKKASALKKRVPKRKKKKS